MLGSAVCFVYPTRSVFVSLVFVQFELLQQSRECLVSWGGGTCLPGSLPKIFVTRQQLGPSHNRSVLLTPLLAPPCRCITSFSNFPAPQIKIRSFINLCTFSMWSWIVLLLFYCPGPSLHELRRVYSLGLDCHVCTDAWSCKEPEHLQLNWKWLSAAVTSINTGVCLHRLWLPGRHFSCWKNNTCFIKWVQC